MSVDRKKSETQQHISVFVNAIKVSCDRVETINEVFGGLRNFRF